MSMTGLFDPHAALGQMHLCFPHSNCLPGHGCPCSSADWPRGLSRACVRLDSWWETLHPEMRSQSVLFNVAWEQAPEHMLLEGGVRVPTDILLVHRALQLSKGVSLPCVRPRTCVSNIWLEPLTPRAYLQPCNLPYILSPLPWAHVRTWVILFPSYPVPCGYFFESMFGNFSAFSNYFLS